MQLKDVIEIDSSNKYHSISCMKMKHNGYQVKSEKHPDASESQFFLCCFPQRHQQRLFAESSILI